MKNMDYGQVVADLLSAYSYPVQPAGLYQPIEYALDCGGKRIRPQLLLASCEALGGDVKLAGSAALGIEMFHNFTLLHDDVMDRAELRRGRPTVHVKWNDDTAILSGDTMLTLATQLIADVPSAVLSSALKLFNSTAIEVYEGQQYDMDFEKMRYVAIDQYLEMIRLKTSVLLGCACQMGALIAGATADVQRAFYQYGVNLGLAFQLRDDWLDTFGDREIFGKAIGGDILNRKKTWLLITALNECGEELESILSEDLTDEEMIKQVTEVFNNLNLSERCQALISDYGCRAIKSLEQVEMSEASREWFKMLTEQLSSRKN